MSSRTDRQVVHFEGFILDLRSGELWKQGVRHLLSEQQFRLLALLLRDRGALVTREDLRRELWPDGTFVDFEPGLNAAMRRLRETLGDSAEVPRFIETLPRRGYRFIAPVVDAPDSPAPPLESREERTAAASAAASPSAPPARTRMSVRLVGAGALAAAAIGLVLAVAGPSSETRVTPGDVRMSPVTRLGSVRFAALSPDGRSYVYVSADGTRQSLWLGPARPPRQLVAERDGVFRAVAFDPRGAVHYALFSPHETHVARYRVPTDGGAPVLVSMPGGAVAFSPDGSQVAHVSNSSMTGPDSRLLLDSADGSTQTVLAVRRPPESFVYLTPAWSPDGLALAVMARRQGALGFTELLTLDRRTGRQLSSRLVPIAVPDQLLWRRDGSFLIAARARFAQPRRLWFVAPGSSEPTAITTDAADYSLAGETPDGRHVMAVRAEVERQVWVADTEGATRPRVIAQSAGSLDDMDGIAWTPDGRVLYPALDSGNVDLWSIDPASGVRRRLTSDAGDDYHPAVAAGGRIAFASDRSGTLAVWTMAADGSEARQVSDGVDQRPSISPDARWLVLQRSSGLDTTPFTLWRSPLEPGAAHRVGPSEAIRPALSPDGRLVAHYWMTPERWTLAITPVDGQMPVRTVPLRPTHSQRVVRWSPDGSAIAFIDSVDGTPNVWLHELEGGAPPRRLTNATEGRMVTFDWSRDGRWLAWTSVREAGDVVMLDLTAGASRGAVFDPAVTRGVQ